jgi:hypothetical protein
MLIVYPLGSVCAIAALAALRREASSPAERAAIVLVALAAVAVGAVAQACGFVEVRRTKNDLIGLQRVIEQDALPVVTDLYWLPSALPATFLGHPLFTLAAPEDLGRWIARTPGGANGFRLIFDPETSPLDAWLAATGPIQFEIVEDRNVRGLRAVELHGGPPKTAGDR